MNEPLIHATIALAARFAERSHPPMSRVALALARELALGFGLDSRDREALLDAAERLAAPLEEPVEDRGLERLASGSTPILVLDVHEDQRRGDEDLVRFAQCMTVVAGDAASFAERPLEAQLRDERSPRERGHRGMYAATTAVVVVAAIATVVLCPLGQSFREPVPPAPLAENIGSVPGGAQPIGPGIRAWIQPGETTDTQIAPALKSNAAVANSEPPSLVDVEIRVSPEFAKVSIDGKDVDGNPFSSKYPSDDVVHLIRASAPGFIPKSTAITLNSNLVLYLSLVPIEQAPPSMLSTSARPPVSIAIHPLNYSDLRVTPAASAGQPAQDPLETPRPGAVRQEAAASIDRAEWPVSHDGTVDPRGAINPPIRRIDPHNPYGEAP